MDAIELGDVSHIVDLGTEGVLPGVAENNTYSSMSMMIFGVFLLFNTSNSSNCNSSFHYTCWISW